MCLYFEEVGKKTNFWRNFLLYSFALRHIFFLRPLMFEREELG